MQKTDLKNTAPELVQYSRVTVQNCVKNSVYLKNNLCTMLLLGKDVIKTSSPTPDYKNDMLLYQMSI